MGNRNKDAVVRLIASEKTWVEGEAVRQLEETAKFRNMITAVGLPDIHPGKGTPIGAAFVSEGVVYPHLVGNDVGCGIGLWRAGITEKKFKPEKAARKLVGLDDGWTEDPQGWLAAREVKEDMPVSALGTIGGGNHFAEFQAVDEVFDEDGFHELGLETGRLHLVVHSGSRGVGETLLRNHVANHGTSGLDIGTQAFGDYIRAHDDALAWAAANRELIALRILQQVGTTGAKVLDLCHNSVTPAPGSDSGTWLHRKGAAPSDAGPILIPGSRGALSYLVRPTGGQAGNAWSVAHGAGRKWNRSDSRHRLSRRFKPEDLRRNGYGGRVICDDKSLLYEEAPQAYKNIGTVVQDLVDTGIVKVLAVFRPVLTYKTRRA